MVSIGNLSVGGTGKTPIVAAVARWLVAAGERPAILSRGYKRRDPVPGVVVVSDGTAVIGTLAQAGDEPLMLARAVPGAIVCVAEDRHLAGVLAERVLGATVHVLDDGFQHLGLARDLDVLVTTMGEIPNGHVLPRGRLREPADAASRAHLLVVMGATSGAAAAEGWTLGVGETCGARRVLGPPRALGTRFADDGRGATSDGIGRAREGTVVLVAGIANPERFADDVRAAGWNVAGELWFPDHHDFTSADVERMAATVAGTGAAAVLTTEKDAVRFEPHQTSFPLLALPLEVAFDPPGTLFDRLGALLAARRAAGDAA